MKKDDEVEAQVLRRYLELAGLVKDGRMVNRDKESRAREYVKLYTRITEQADERNRTLEKSKYGALILQANEVQYYLGKLILLRSFSPSKRFEEDLGRLQLGPSISYLNVCAQTKKDLDLISWLTNYKKKRDALAHKMFTAEKLTPKDCEIALRSGKRIIDYLAKSLKEKHKYMVKSSDTLNHFREQFNKLAKEVKAQKQRIIKLEQVGKKSKKKP